ncbi:hypothetical protein [Methylobacterium dankookense]|uniref:Uncharacterized protein n=1 Tax=Methylobacterium dankookense TaxID=560405 RepID=A0A564FSK2_9HYPH|nr:hypothetical protein [Methylobacterium dankookense]GJD57175.1 hypothetical protein IFDJLNFL_3075 [Methylobacterium dankookense]VUF10794.1 hypothetical protein MTDSW087_00466 [Methylobacterium dankookense]
MRRPESVEAKPGRNGWIARRLDDAIVFAAGLGLALPLILPFA